jgi:integrase
MRFHDLRHSAVTFLLADGNYAKVVSTLVGHSSAAFTLDQYGYVTPDMQEALVQTMEKLFGENGRQNGRQKEQ